MTEASNKEAHAKSRADTADFGKMLDRDVLGYFPVKLVPAITGLVTIMILTRNLVPEQYGTYSVVMATVLLMSQIFGAWISNSVLYVYPDYQKDNDFEFKFYTMCLQGVAAFFACSIGYVAILMTTHNHLLGLIGALILASSLSQFLMMTFLQSTRKVSAQALSVIIQSLTQLSVLCILIFVFKGKEAAVLAAILAGYLACIPVLIFKVGLIPNKRSKGNNLSVRYLFRRLFSYGMPMCVWYFATQFYTVGDRILLKLLGISAGLGQYAAFRDLATGCAGFLTMPLLMASHPIIMKMWKDGSERAAIEKLVTRNLVILIILFVPIIVVVDLCGSELMAKIFGQKYLIDRITMLLVIGSIFLGCLTMYVQKGMEVTGKTLRMAEYAFFVATISCLANIFVIPLYGVIGAATIVVVVQIFYAIFVWYETKDTLKAIVPLSFLYKMVLWVIGVEAVCRVLGSLSWALGLFWASTLLRLVLISGATCALYVTNNEISSICNAILQSFRKPLGSN